MNIRRLLNTRKNNLKKLRVSKGWDCQIPISVLYNPRSRLINITFILPLGYDFS